MREVAIGLRARATPIAMALTALVAACGSRRTEPEIVARRATDAGTTASPVDAGSRVDGSVDDSAQAIRAFAATRGGLHAAPVRLPAGESLFFVGGDVAHAAWIAPARPAATAMRPVEVPRAVRVVDVLVHEQTAYVIVESVAALDQPAGLRGVVAAAGPALPWHWGEARSAAELRSRLAEQRLKLPAKWDDMARFALASKSLNGIAAEIGRAGADVYETWQGALVRRVEHVDAASLGTSPRREAIRGLLERVGGGWATCREETAMCLVGHIGDQSNDEGIALAEDGGTTRVRALFLASPRSIRATAETAPAKADGDAVMETWRYSQDAPSPPRVLAQADIGGGRVLGAVHDGERTWVVEREGPYSMVVRVEGAERPDGKRRGIGLSPGVRILDLDGDGIADFLVLDTSSQVPRAYAYRRSHRIEDGPHRDFFGAEVAMLGAMTLDEAERLARAPITRVNIGQAEACAIATRASTARGFRSLAAPGARVVVRAGSFTDGVLKRVIPVADVKDEDVESLACRPDRNAGCFVEERLRGVCSIGPDETQTVNAVFRLVRIGGAIKIDVVSVFGE